MSPVEQYVFLRQAGFTHEEAINFINKGIVPNQNTQMKQKAMQRLQQGVKHG